MPPAHNNNNTYCTTQQDLRMHPNQGFSEPSFKHLNPIANLSLVNAMHYTLAHVILSKSPQARLPPERFWCNIVLIQDGNELDETVTLILALIKWS